jgi:hypothetical protein
MAQRLKGVHPKKYKKELRLMQAVVPLRRCTVVPYDSGAKVKKFKKSPNKLYCII